MNAPVLQRKHNHDDRPQPVVEVGGSSAKDDDHSADTSVDSERWSGDVEKQQQELRRLFIGIGILLIVCLPFVVWLGFFISNAMQF